MDNNVISTEIAEVNNEITPFDSNNILNDLDRDSAMWSSMPMDDMESKIKIYNATNQADHTVKEMLNKPIEMVDVVITVGSTVDDNGNINETPRVCIFDKDGNTYHAMSWGVYRSICRIRSLFKTLHFETPLKVIPKETKTKNGFSVVLSIQ